MPRFESADWYDHPRYYDIVFDPDTPNEVDFLEQLHFAYGSGATGKRVLEPACGSGRLLAEFARRGWEATGFDLNERMLDYARKRRIKGGTPIEVFAASMESFEPVVPCALAFCLLSTFKYVLTGHGALSHLQRVAGSLHRGGLYVLGIHLTNYDRRTNDSERWVGERKGVRVVSTTDTWPPNRETRLEKLRNRMSVRERQPDGTLRMHRFETRWKCRTYDARQLRALIAKVPEFEIVGCHDFFHDIQIVRELDDSKEDVVVVLRKR